MKDKVEEIVSAQMDNLCGEIERDFQLTHVEPSEEDVNTFEGMKTELRDFMIQHIENMRKKARVEQLKEEKKKVAGLLILRLTKLANDDTTLTWEMLEDVKGEIVSLRESDF